MAQLFPRKANALPALSLLGALGGGVLLIGFIWYYFSPEFYEVGYQPEQPVPYSHAQHVGQLGMDCRYCHNHVEQSTYANIPPTQTCMNCHGQIKAEALSLLPVRTSWATGEPIEWVQVTHLPDYAHFPHDAHIAVGVGCESCHGRIDQMPEVYVAEPLSMGWCLECHRNPEEHLRDPADVTRMGLLEEVRETKESYSTFVEANLARIAAEGINPPENCSACHY